MISRFIGIAPVFALCACTSLSTTTDIRTVSADRAVAGVPYSLPMAQFDIEVTRSIVQCFAPQADGKPDLSRPEVKFAIEVKATPRTVIGETYIIDPTELSGPTKTSNLTITTHESGTLKSINAAVEDRSGPIIASLARAAIGGAGLVAGVRIPSGGGNPALRQIKEIRCADGTQAHLDAADTASGAVTTARTALKATSDRISFLTEQATAGRLSDQGRTELVAKLTLQRGQTTTLTNAQSALDQVQALVSSKTTMRWPLQFNDFSEPVADMTAGDMSRLRRLLHLVPGTADQPNACAVEDTTAPDADDVALSGCLQARFKTMVGLIGLTSTPTGMPDSDTRALDPTIAQDGLFFRPPERARLVACRSANPCTAVGSLLWASDDLWIPQLGQLRFLEFRNEMFENSSLTLSLRADGTAESIGYANKSAQLEGMADAVEDLVGQATAFDTRIRADRVQRRSDAAALVAAERADELALLRQQIDMATLEAQLAALNRPPAAPGDIDLARAQAELAAARATIAQAQLAERAALAALAALPAVP